MNKEEFLGKLQMCYFGERNAFDEIVSEYDRLNNIIDELEKYLEKFDFNAFICGNREASKSIELGARLNNDFILDKLKELKEGKG